MATAATVARLDSRIPQIIEKIGTGMEETIKEVADKIVEGAQKNIEPHNETGALHDSIHSTTVNPLHRHVTAGDEEEVDYSFFVEFGTRYRPATPYFVPAVEEAQKLVQPGSLLYHWTREL